MKVLENKIPPLIVLLIMALLMQLLSAYLPVWDIGLLPSGIIALMVALSGIWFAVSGVMEFRKSQTTVDPRQPEKASELVISGVYQRSRNPMYVGLACLLVAQTIFLQSPLLILGVVTFVLYLNRFQIQPEERAMVQCFGESYLQYRLKVRRWL